MAWERPVLGRWFEEFEVGQVVPHALTRTITESDNIGFSVATLNPAPLHLDSHYAAETEFGRPLVNSMLTLALLVGISEQVTFPAPLFPGDSVHAETEVMAVRDSGSRPDAGIVTFEHRAYNQDDTLVCRATRTALMHRCPP